MTQVADGLRVLCVILAVITAAISFRVAYDKTYRNKGQLFRFLGLAFLALAVSYREYHALGHAPNWPILIFNMLGIAFSLRGTVPLVLQNRKQKADNVID